MCAELADLAMQLARAAAARTLTNWAEAEPAPDSNQPPSPTQAAEPQPEPQSKTASPHAQTPTYRQTDPAILFTRLAAVVRDCIALENRLAAGPATHRAPARAPTRAPANPTDPRRPPLREAIGVGFNHYPNRADIVRQLTARTEEILAADPEQTQNPLEILQILCDELDIDISWSKLSDEYLEIFCAYQADEGQKPDPHATSPP